MSSEEINVDDILKKLDKSPEKIVLTEDGKLKSKGTGKDEDEEDDQDIKLPSGMKFY